jgi:hypothetical protein
MVKKLFAEVRKMKKSKKRLTPGRYAWFLKSLDQVELVSF